MMKRRRTMEETLRLLDIGVSRVRDIRTVLLVWDEVLALAEGQGYTPGQILRSLNVRVSMPGWISNKEVALNLSAPMAALEHLLEVLPGEGLVMKQLAGRCNLSRRYRLASRPP
jgi:hypothetical protein